MKLELKRLLVLLLATCSAPFSLIFAQTPVKLVQTGALKTVTAWAASATAILDTMVTTAAKVTALAVHTITRWMAYALLPVLADTIKILTLKPVRNATVAINASDSQLFVQDASPQ
jgi:hypothetical protein